jgi:hypothetical protein
MNEARDSDVAYVSGIWHSWHLAKVLMHGLELKGFNETLEMLEKGLKKVYDLYGKETLEWVVKIMFEEFQKQLSGSGVVVVN